MDILKRIRESRMPVIQMRSSLWEGQFDFAFVDHQINEGSEGEAP